MTPVVAIVGRPNVGKSTLFNCLVGKRRAIVHNRPGVTRDRIMERTLIRDIGICLVDTGGFISPDKELLHDSIRGQVFAAMKEADVLLVVFDGRAGCVPLDEEVVKLARKTGKPIVGVVNKVDPGAKNLPIQEFQKFGFKALVETAAEHRDGISDVEEKLVELFKDMSVDMASESIEDDSRIHVALLGRPNMGKSSMINALIDEPRQIVSEYPGTTRDTVNIEIERRGKKFLFIDTAGVRKKQKVSDILEKRTSIAAFKTLDLAHVAVLVLDAEEGVTVQDEKLAAAAIEHGCALIIVANKWDLVDDTQAARAAFREELRATAPFLSFASIRFASAKTGMGIPQVLGDVGRVYRKLTQDVSTDDLRDAFKIISTKYKPGGTVGVRLKLFKLTFEKGDVPIFLVWCNNPKLIEPAYEKYWFNALSDRMDMEGVPFRVIFKRKGSKGRQRTKSRSRSRA